MEATPDERRTQTGVSHKLLDDENGKDLGGSNLGDPRLHSHGDCPKLPTWTNDKVLLLGCLLHALMPLIAR